MTRYYTYYMSGTLSSADLELIGRIADRQRRENEEIDQASLLRLAKAREEARRLACRLLALPDVKRVLLFGSAASGRRFGPASDIDLAMEGGDLLEGMGIVEKSSFPVDIVSLDSIHPIMRARIEKEGVTLHEADES